MASKNKRTTMAKLNRENKLRERRMEKQARKDARKREAAVQRDMPADQHGLGEDLDLEVHVDGDGDIDVEAEATADDTTEVA